MNTKKLTHEQAAIISAFTGIMAARFDIFHEYAERKLGRPVLTHEFGDSGVMKELKAEARDDFLAICPET